MQRNASPESWFAWLPRGPEDRPDSRHPDPGETKDLATDPAYQRILLQYRELLAAYGREHHDPLAAELLADNVKPRPFNRSLETNRPTAP